MNLPLTEAIQHFKETWQPSSLTEAIQRFKETPQSGIDIAVLEKGISNGELSPEEQANLNETFITSYNRSFVAGFPRDAFNMLRGQNLIAENIPPREDLDLDENWKEIAKLVELNIPQQEITTNVVYNHFKRFIHQGNRIPNHENISQKISQYISECIRRAHKKNDPELLQKVIPAFKTLAYLIKSQGSWAYSCESEYDVMVRFGVDSKKMDFKFLDDDEITEKILTKHLARLHN